MASQEQIAQDQGRPVFAWCDNSAHGGERTAIYTRHALEVHKSQGCHPILINSNPNPEVGFVPPEARPGSTPPIAQCMVHGDLFTEEEAASHSVRSGCRVRTTAPQNGAGGPHPPEVVPMDQWWRVLSEVEINKVVPKAMEYGSADLKLMGEALLLTMPQLVANLHPSQMAQAGQEVAVAFYLLGKVSRLFGAYERGQMPSDDTWHDAGVYARMAQRIRQNGEWS